MFCIYVFAKNQRENISAKELKVFKEMASYLLGLKDLQIKKSIEGESLFEVK